DAQDLSVYLEDAGARARIVADASAVAQLTAHAAAPMVVIQYVERTAKPDVAASQLAPVTPTVSHVLLMRGRRRRCRVEALSVVTLDRDALRRDAFLRAVAVAAGRALPESEQVSTEERPA